MFEVKMNISNSILNTARNERESQMLTIKLGYIDAVMTDSKLNTKQLAESTIKLLKSSMFINLLQSEIEQLKTNIIEHSDFDNTIKQYSYNSVTGQAEEDLSIEELSIIITYIK